MFITLCDVPTDREESLTNIGGEIMRSFNGLSDIQFDSDDFSLSVRGDYIKIRNRTMHKTAVIWEDEFTNVIIN